jgi:Ca2+-transporting ATPase
LQSVEGQGLSHAEAAARLETDGYNELPSPERRRILHLALELLREPMVYLLLGCGAVYMVLGDKQEAAMLLGFLGVILGITLYQERKAERALHALRELSSPRALVVRNGRRERIPGREVVRGDILVLAEGDRVPADGDVLSSLNLNVDESLLTGEAVPVGKVAGTDRAFAGTTVVRGTGTVKVTSIGAATEIGKIGGIIKASSTGPTRLELETRRLVRIIATAAAILCLAVVGAYVSY